MVEYVANFCLMHESEDFPAFLYIRPRDPEQLEQPEVNPGLETRGKLKRFFNYFYQNKSHKIMVSNHI